jgi:hypothetical protein
MRIAPTSSQRRAASRRHLIAVHAPMSGRIREHIEYTLTVSDLSREAHDGKATVGFAKVCLLTTKPSTTDRDVDLQS